MTGRTMANQGHYKPGAPRALTAKQAAFIEEYLKDFNATAAAKRAGYSERSAHQRGYELVHNPEVAATIKERGASDAEVLGITRGWILSRLQVIAIAAEDAGKFGPANRALELLAKLRGDLIDRSEVKTLGVSIVLNGVNVEDLK